MALKKSDQRAVSIAVERIKRADVEFGHGVFRIHDDLLNHKTAPAIFFDLHLVL